MIFTYLKAGGASATELCYHIISSSSYFHFNLLIQLVNFNFINSAFELRPREQHGYWSEKKVLICSGDPVLVVVTLQCRTYLQCWPCTCLKW